MELVEVAPHVYACLQPENGLGDSNSGFVARGGGLVVDSFYDLPRTHQMIDLYASVHPEPARRLVNTHHNGDHCWGNQLFAEAGAEIIAHERCAEYFLAEATPELFTGLVEAAEVPEAMADFVDGLRRFDFRGIALTPPTTTIADDVTLDVDGTEVQLLSIGPAHTAGDVAVFVPADGVLFTGDVLFNQCAPLGWEGTYERWIAGLERLAALDPAVVVPGHGPVCGTDELLAMRDYLAYVRDESAAHHAAGRSVLDAARRIELGPYAGWNEPERLVFQVDRAYRELDGVPWDTKVDVIRLFGEMATLRRELAERPAS